MPLSTIVEAEAAALHLDDPAWLFIDTRFTLGSPNAGRDAYLAEHIAGAVYADLEQDLSGPILTGFSGRHPLPASEVLDVTLSRLGVRSAAPVSQVVCYDAGTGALAAARLWWLLRWAGHEAVAVLNGGLARWRELELPRRSGPERRPPGEFHGSYRPELLAGAHEVQQLIAAGGTVADARAADRFRGENETIDPVAGHIPGACSAPYAGNLDGAGRFLPAAELRERFKPLLNGRDATSLIFYCGSGVTAAHNVLATVHAGLGMPRLYAGSWSEWITDPRRTIATGE